MMLHKKTMYLSMLLIAFSIVAFISINSKKQLPEEKPKDFNFVFNYGVNARNQLDTIKGKYTMDMVVDPSVITDLKLSDEEINTIYTEMKKINILSYPDNFNPKSNAMRTPFYTYNIKVIIDGKEKYIYWKDENVSKSNEAVQLRELFNKIEEIIVNKEEFKKLPSPRGGYD